MKCDVRGCKEEALNRDILHDINVCNKHAFEVDKGKLKMKEIAKDKIRQGAENKAMDKMNQILSRM